MSYNRGPGGRWEFELPALVLAALMVGGVPMGFGAATALHAGPNAVPAAGDQDAGSLRAMVRGGPELTAARPTPTGDVTPSGSGVNPYRDYSAEPAPVGLADYGIDAGGNPTNYSTPIFLGQMYLANIATLNSSLPEPRAVSFQLNVNLYFSKNSTVYVYWVQDALEFNTSSGVVHFIDNVWNASGPGAQMMNSSISGLGTVANSSTGHYYLMEAGALAGEAATLELPAEVDLQVTSTLLGGAPALDFGFQDGYGWEGYDAVSFPFAVGATDSGFVVNGYEYRPDGGYLDAELTMGGSSPDTQTNVDASSVNLELEYWNGHNMQEVVNAYNFGSDTREGVTDAASGESYDTGNGTLYAGVRANASGALGPLYDRGQVGLVNISTSVPAGALYVNGTFYGAYQGGEANLTLAPGNYTFAIYDDGLLEGAQTALVPAGGYVALKIAWQDIYTVTFFAAGLPSGITWSVSLNGSSEDTDTGALSYVVASGNYDYEVSPLSGYVATPSAGNVTVGNQAVNVTITWSVRGFTISFVAKGLPDATLWSVSVGGAPFSATNATINVTEPAGTYAYSVGSVAGFRASPTVGAVDLVDAGHVVNVTWTRFTYPVDFIESGLPAGLSWSLSIESNGLWFNSSGSAAIDPTALPNGTFSYLVGGPTGYAPETPQSTSDVDAQGLDVSVVFLPTDGYIAGTIAPGSASLWIDNVSVNVTNGTFNVSVAPGEHLVRASASGFATMEMELTVIAGQVTPVAWQLSSLASSAASPLSNPWVDALLGLAIVIAVVAIWVGLRRRRGPNAPAEPPAP